MKYRLSAAAQTDLDDLWNYIAQENPPAADRFLDSLADKLRMLGSYPNLGRKSDEIGQGIQRFPAGAYVIFYRVQAEHVEIIRILHGARDIEAVFEPDAS